MSVYTNLSISIERILHLSILTLLSFAILVAFKLQLVEMYGYMGFQPFETDLRYIFITALSVIIISALMPATIRRPSDFFSFLFGLFVALPYMVLHPIGGAVESLGFITNLFLLLIPILSVRLCALLACPIRTPIVLTQEKVINVVLIVCFFGTCWSVLNAPSTAGFDMGLSYERRIEGRETFPGGTFVAYLNSIVVNGLAPFIAFLGGARKQYWLSVFALACGISFFYILGLKAPVFYIFIASIMGCLSRDSKIKGVPKIFMYLLLGSFLLAALEVVIFFDYSLVVDYFHRRVFSIPPFVLSGYFDLMFIDPSSGWSLLYGLNPPEGITFLVGEKYFGNPNTNANTNAFILQLAAGGLLPYLLTISLVSVIFCFLDSIFLSRRDPVQLYIGFSYAILLLEQSATTALVSSGVAVLIFLSIICRSEGGFVVVRMK